MHTLTDLTRKLKRASALFDFSFNSCPIDSYICTEPTLHCDCGPWHSREWILWELRAADYFRCIYLWQYWPALCWWVCELSAKRHFTKCIFCFFGLSLAIFWCVYESYAQLITCGAYISDSTRQPFISSVACVSVCFFMYLYTCKIVDFFLSLFFKRFCHTQALSGPTAPSFPTFWILAHTHTGSMRSLILWMPCRWMVISKSYTSTHIHHTHSTTTPHTQHTPQSLKWCDLFIS